VDANLPVLALGTMREHLDESFDLWVVRTGARIFIVFGGVALLLAAIGLYGVRAYNVAMRTREIGIRMALGANASDAVRMLLREGLMLMAIGAGVGLVLSVGVGKVLSNLLYRVNSFDPVVLIGAPALLSDAGEAEVACCYGLSEFCAVFQGDLADLLASELFGGYAGWIAGFAKKTVEAGGRHDPEQKKFAIRIRKSVPGVSRNKNGSSLLQQVWRVVQGRNSGSFEQVKGLVHVEMPMDRNARGEGDLLGPKSKIG
jgi:hypothetical protein